MELSFDEVRTSCLKTVMRQTVSQEETAELIVPDSSPDVERILDCTGMAMLRSKECREGGITISGGVHADVLFLAENEQQPRAMQSYLPFSIRVENPALTGQSRVACELKIRSIDARMLNPRKALVRVTVVCAVTACEPAMMMTWTVMDHPALQVRRKTLPVRMVQAFGEKPFLVNEEFELPGGRPAIAEVYRWSAEPYITEQKTIGSRVAFKGGVNVRALYRGVDDTINVWTIQTPFSQYADLDQDCDGEDAVVLPVMTGAELQTDADESSRKAVLNLNITAQCAAISQQSLDVIEDLYSTTQSIVPQMQTLQLESRLDRQTLHESARQTMELPAQDIVDVAVLLDVPVLEHHADTLTVTVPAQINLLCRDADGQMLGRSAKSQVTCEMKLHPDAMARVQAMLSGEPYAAVTPGGAEVSFAVDMPIEYLAQTAQTVVSGAQCEDRALQSQPRPAVIIRAADPGQTLWSMAKACNTTVSAICQANHLSEEAAPSNTLLLIPLEG